MASSVNRTPLQRQALQIAKLPGGGSIIDVEGDLMTAPNSLAHCVSACLGMGKGIAVHFKKNFGQVDKLKAQNVGVGGVAVLARPEENRFIYYLITKPKYFHKPTYDTLRASLKQMVQHMVANQVSSVSLPELGCGLDGLQWPHVYRMLGEEFKNTGIDVTVFHFRGPGQTAPPTLPDPKQVVAGLSSDLSQDQQQQPQRPPNSAAASTSSTTNDQNNNQQQQQQAQSKAVSGQQKKSFADMLREQQQQKKE